MNLVEGRGNTEKGRLEETNLEGGEDLIYTQEPSG